MVRVPTTRDFARRSDDSMEGGIETVLVEVSGYSVTNCQQTNCKFAIMGPLRHTGAK